MNLNPLPPNSVLGFTGHRPPRLGGYDEQTSNKCYRLATRVIEVTKPEFVISGFALGWDMEVAFAAIVLGVPVIAAVPYDGHHVMWRLDAQERMRKLLLRCHRVEYVCPPGYQSYKLHTRNKWIVDNATHLCSLWDGNDDGGTYRCIQYAEREGLPMFNVWEEFMKME